MFSIYPIPRAKPLETRACISEGFRPDAKSRFIFLASVNGDRVWRTEDGGLRNEVGGLCEDSIGIREYSVLRGCL